jgi:hypothetical protein
MMNNWFQVAQMFLTVVPFVGQRPSVTSRRRKGRSEVVVSEAELAIPEQQSKRKQKNKNNNTNNFCYCKQQKSI